jgi:hypothetical protein
MELKGIYTVDNNKDVHLMEIIFGDSPGNVDVGQITQELVGQPKGNWQSPWDEKYLDDEGQEIIGDYSDIPTEGITTRLLFFFHFLDLSKPLLTQYGPIDLTGASSIPPRLHGKVKYESPD